MTGEIDTERGWTFEWIDGVAAKAEYHKLQRKRARIERLLGWTRKIPFIGSLVWVFWSSMLDEGPYQTLKPRWGALTFAFLNDGFPATIWHTWRQITHDNTDPYTGIYTFKAGAPHSLAEAQEWDKLPPELWSHDHGRTWTWILESSIPDPKTGTIKDRFVKGSDR